MLRIELDEPPSTCRPGSTLTGRCVWEMNQAPERLEASLEWMTEGKGDEDGDTAIVQQWKPTSDSGSHRFRWQLPRGPLSLDGTLIRIRWKLLLRAESPDEEVSLPLVISHVDGSIRLSSIATAL